MKIPALLSALALACGAALAAPQYGSSPSDRDAAAGRNQSAAVSSDTSRDAKGGGFIERTKEAFQRLGDKIRNATRKSTDGDETNAKTGKGDTRSMGAAGSPSQDSARQRRMDEAYANSKKQQK